MTKSASTVRRAGVQYLMLMVAAAQVACGGSSVTDSARVASISLKPEAVTVSIGSFAPLNVDLVDDNGQPVANRQVSWTSSDTKVATVSSSGVVTALKVGEATIAATVHGMSATAVVTVSQRAVTSVSVSPPTAAIRVGETTQLSAQTLDAAGQPLSDRSVTWASSNNAIATVDADGVVVGKLPGAVTITATSEGRSGSAAITVSLLPVGSVSVSPGTASLNVGETTTLAATPRDASGAPLTGRTVTWSSNAQQIATVSSSGVVTALSPGTATISATSEGRTGNAVVTVTNRAVNSVTVSPSTNTITQGTTTQLGTTITDIVGNILTGRAITWSSSNTSVATVNASGLVTGVAPGDVTISATSEGKIGSATIHVTATPVSTVAVTPGTATILPGATTTLQATARSASGAVLNGRQVSWTSGAPGIATVNGSGVVTGVSNGTAIIFANVDGVIGSATITVQRPAVATVATAPLAPTVALGSSRQLTATVRDASGNLLTDRLVTWTSSDESRVFVNSEGLVFALKRGSAVVTATVEGKSASTVVTVN